VVELHDTVAEPEFVTLLGEIAAHDRPNGTVSAKLTAPVKPLSAVIVTVDVEDVSTVTAAGDVAEMLKSVIVSVAVVWWLSAPLVPVSVRE
jgi:hypothetical protein